MFEKIKKASLYISILITIINAYTLIMYSDYSFMTIFIFTCLKLYLLLKQYYIYVFWGLIVFYIYTSIFDLKKEAFTQDEDIQNLYETIISINIDDIDPINLEGDNDYFIELLNNMKSAVTLEERENTFLDMIEYIDGWFDMYNEYKSSENTEELDDMYHEKDSAFLQFLNSNGIFEEDIKDMVEV